MLAVHCFLSDTHYVVHRSMRQAVQDFFLNNYDLVQGFEKAVVTCSTGTLQLKRMPDNIVETTDGRSKRQIHANI